MCPAEDTRAQSLAQGLDLQWDSPAACMNAPAARAEINKLILDDGGEATSRTRARVQIEGTPKTGYVAEIEVARGSNTGERTVRGARCAEVAEAAVLIIAMVIDPEAAARASSQRSSSSPEPAPLPSAPTPTSSTEPALPPEPAPEEAQAPEPQRPAPKAEEPEQEREPEEEESEPEEEEPEPEEEEPEEPSDPRAAGRLLLGVLGGGDAGSLPQLTAHGGLFAGIAWQRTRLELRAAAYLPQVEGSGPAPDSRTEIDLYAGALAGCFDVLGSRDEARALGTCAVVEAGLSSAQPSGFSDGQQQQGLWLAGLLGLDGRQQLLGPLHLRLYLEAGIPVLRPAYEVEPFGLVFRASPVLARFGISAFVLFP